MKLPVAAQILQHLGSHRHHAVLPALSIAHHDLALVAEDVMHREREAFREPQARAVNQFDRNAITPQPDRPQKPANLFAREHGRQFLVIPCANLGKHLPFRMAQHLREKNPRTGHRLANGLRLPLLAGLHIQNVVTELILSQSGRIDAEMLVQDAHGPVITMPSARAIILQRKQFRVSSHRVVRMLVIQWIPMPTTSSRRGNDLRYCIWVTAC